MRKIIWTLCLMLCVVTFGAVVWAEGAKPEEVLKVGKHDYLPLDQAYRDYFNIDHVVLTIDANANKSDFPYIVEDELCTYVLNYIAKHTRPIFNLYGCNSGKFYHGKNADALFVSVRIREEERKISGELYRWLVITTETERREPRRSITEGINSIYVPYIQNKTEMKDYFFKSFNLSLKIFNRIKTK